MAKVILQVEDRPKLTRKSRCEGEIAGFLPANRVLTECKTRQPCYSELVNMSLTSH
jgi:hypothetical protein